MSTDIDIDSETIIGLFEVPQHCPGPRKPTRATVFRWVFQGLRIAGTDERVKLPSVKLNGIRCTSIEGVSRFLRAANGQFDAAANVIERTQPINSNPTTSTAG